jgi:hypothetical protein
MPAYNIELTSQADGSVTGYVYCLYPDKSYGHSVKLNAEEIAGLDDAAVRQAAYEQAQPHIDEWLAQKQQSQAEPEGNFTPGS